MIYSPCLTRSIKFMSTSNEKAIFNVLKHLLTKHNEEVHPKVKYLQQLVPKRSMLKRDYLEVFQDIDLEWCRYVSKLNLSDYLMLLNTWSVEQHGLLSKSLFYQTFLERLKNDYWKDPTWDQLVQVAYFLGYLKDQTVAKPLFLHCLQKINSSPSLEDALFKDICIICEASYKISVVIPAHGLIIKKITKILKDNLQNLLQEPYWLIMLIKTLRLSNYYNVHLLQQFSNDLQCKSEVAKLPFTTQSYILSLFADAQLRDDKLISILIKSMLEKFQSVPWRDQTDRTYFLKGLRSKDVNTFLWAASSLNYALSTEQMQHDVEPFLTWNYKNGTYKTSPELLVQCLISLWMMNLTTVELFNTAVVMDTLNILKGKKNNLRDLSRFSFLIEAYVLENLISLTHQQQLIKVELDKHILIPNIDKVVMKRPLLSKLKDMLTKNEQVDKVTLEYVVPRVYVLGVSVWISNRKFHVDVLDNITCFHGTSIPASLATTKKRLFKVVEPATTYIQVTEKSILEANTGNAVLFFK